MDPQVSQAKPVITARGIGVRGPWGPVYGPVDLDIPEGGLSVLLCPPGEGRTALLMTLAGRMRPETGTLTVCGHTRARDVFPAAAIAGIDELDPIPEAVTVSDLITERLRWNAKWYKVIRSASDDDLRRVCGPVFGDLALPELGRYVDGLTERDQLLLRIALANLNRPPLLVVGGLDAVAADDERADVLGRLIALGGGQTVVTGSVNPLPDDAGCLQIPVANTAPEQLAGRREGAR